jgi:hypothetical protein
MMNLKHQVCFTPRSAQFLCAGPQSLVIRLNRNYGLSGICFRRLSQNSHHRRGNTCLFPLLLPLLLSQLRPLLLHVADLDSPTVENRIDELLGQSLRIDSLFSPAEPAFHSTYSCGERRIEIRLAKLAMFILYSEVMFYFEAVA